MTTVDAVVIGSGFGGSISAFHLAEAGASVMVLERGPELGAQDFQHSFEFGSSSTRIFDFTAGDGMSVLAANCVGGGSVVYFAAMPRVPGFIFDRRGSLNRRLWPEAITRESLDPWYDRVARALPVRRHDWDEVSYAGGLWAAMCDHAGHTANPLPSAVDTDLCTNCNWMMAGCTQDAKRSMLLNYLPGARKAGATVRPLHEVQRIERLDDDRYRVHYEEIHPVDYRESVGSGHVDCRVVVVAAGAGATPVLLQRSADGLGELPHAVGRYFSGNGERINVAVIDDDAVGSTLGLRRRPGLAYGANQIGRGPVVSAWDNLDPAAAEFERFAVEQLYFPPGLGTVLADTGEAGGQGWFGLGKKEMLSEWASWLLLFELIEDDNEGVFGAPPERGNAERLSQQLLGRGTLTYRPRASTREAWARADAFVREVITEPGFGTVTPWTNDLVGAYTVHPLASCRIGDDPAISALDDTHELRGHPGIFVVDGSAVPTALTVNPSNTIAALAERAAPHIVERLRSRGVDARYRGTLPTEERA
ncbi:FAD-dependent oxidoreductase [Myceligenerans salitolerans]|uniref:Cholesterol oxidase n=1 Tax=Myceligenerans salitolerans TaxID=1230528 RepID=A0ABS3IE16_9MICO|nr:GMC family oxidoreductase [Myceligenerans salitolerans]MBO0611220.1 GMC family oxidoreductase [Myceligenerans salitolerans]